MAGHPGRALPKLPTIDHEQINNARRHVWGWFVGQPWRAATLLCQGCARRREYLGKKTRPFSAEAQSIVRETDTQCDNFKVNVISARIIGGWRMRVHGNLEKERESQK